jgi:ribosomal protein L28
MECYHCGKTMLYGRSHTHHRGVAGGRWKKRAPKTQRIFHPNLQKIEILEKGIIKSVKLCAKCIKRVKKDLRDGVHPFLTIPHFMASDTARVGRETAASAAAASASAAA